MTKNYQNVPRSVLKNINYLLSVRFKLKDIHAIIIEKLKERYIEITNHKSLKQIIIKYIRTQMIRNKIKQRKMNEKKKNQNKSSQTDY